MDDKTRQEAARLLGMKCSEIVAVARAEDGGAVITTHDGQTVYVNEAGEVRPWDGPLPILPPAESASKTKTRAR